MRLKGKKQSDFEIEMEVCIVPVVINYSFVVFVDKQEEKENKSSVN